LLLFFKKEDFSFSEQNEIGAPHRAWAMRGRASKSPGR
jgi:hypothetical protein